MYIVLFHEGVTREGVSNDGVVHLPLCCEGESFSSSQLVVSKSVMVIVGCGKIKHGEKGHFTQGGWTGGLPEGKKNRPPVFGLTLGGGHAARNTCLKTQK